MSNEKSLTQNGLTLPNVLNLLLSVGIIAISAFLTKHFYDVHFPTGIGASDELCASGGFWGCNKTTTSALGNLFYVPTSFFGLVIGLIGLIGIIFPSQKMESTNKTIFLMNGVGCLALMLYSLIALGGLCKLCTVYYLLSWALLALYLKKCQAPFKIDPKIAGIFALIVVLPGIYLNSYYTGKVDKISNLSEQYVNQFKRLKSMGEPSFVSPYYLAKATDQWEAAPIRISIFSDFQCPFCQKVSEQMHEVLKDFKGRINVNYYFYPLDNACNKNVKGSFHQFACKAAYLSACDQDKFKEVHDEIFSRQKDLSFENLEKWQKEWGLIGCFDKKELQDLVVQTINAGDQFKVRSTPTVIINGKKIEGSVPTVHLKAILKSLLKPND